MGNVLLYTHGKGNFNLYMENNSKYFNSDKGNKGSHQQLKCLANYFYTLHLLYILMVKN